ncbi:response regulator [Sporolactobacillus shoreicorticis]|uniref:Response regulator n=1 Tax=Sporolactobacillus shoreicorticis TaxID=1923877 RepID=A0ABW5SAA8_9BACL|nr:response regulator [Sporolactobacillus shoreicorticis]MCO7125596.1 response regulator [Sporolactobacillus shoreicorticis]
MNKQNAVYASKDVNEIMVVDDQPGIRMLLQEVFKQTDYQIVTAANGEQALELLKKEDVRLVLLDMKIPKMNGLEILHKIKEIKPGIKVIIMTAYGENAMVQEALQSGAVAHFTKPFDLHELISAVEKECPKNSSGV